MRLNQHTVACLIGLLLLVAGSLSGQTKCKFNCDESSCMCVLRTVDKEIVQQCQRLQDATGDKSCPYLYYTDAGADGWVPTGTLNLQGQFMQRCSCICPPIAQPGGVGQMPGKAKDCAMPELKPFPSTCAAKCAPPGSS